MYIKRQEEYKFMIRIENLSVSYKETLALKDISLVLQGPTIQYRLQLSHQGQGMCLARTISLYSSLSQFKC